HPPILSAYYEERRRAHALQLATGEVRPPTTRDHGRDSLRDPCSGAERRRRAGTRTEVAYAEIAQLRVLEEPTGRLDQAPRKESDIEDVVAVLGLGFHQEVEEEGGHPRILEYLRDVPVPGAEPAAPGAMGE